MTSKNKFLRFQKKSLVYLDHNLHSSIQHHGQEGEEGVDRAILLTQNRETGQYTK